MNKNLLTLAAALFAALAVFSCHTRSDDEESHTSAAPANEVWVSGKQIHEAAITTTEVEARPVSNLLMTTGRITFSDARVSHIFSPVTGRVTQLLANMGDHVAAGSPLAIVQSPDVGTAVSDLEKADADLAAAHNEYEREKELYEGHAAAQRDLEAAESAYRKAKAERERAAEKNSLLIASGRGTGQGFVLRAPIGGDVIARSVSLGMEVQGQYSGGNAPELFTIGNIDPVWLMADVFEVDLSRVRIGAPVTVNVVSYPGHPFTGTVDWISGALDPATRSAKVRCTIRNANHLLRPEMYATVSIATEAREKLAAPRTAIVRVGDQMVAFVDKGQSPNGGERFERRIVSVDETEAGDYVPVLRGLAPGERVVSSGAIILTGSGS
jgi:cobalt-zinc-cadmium efflux system membrane fusion protein